MTVYLTSYATPDFEGVRHELNVSAARFGISNHFSYTKADLHSSEFYRQNRSILDEICGAGYWAWKPHFILEAMGNLQDGDILFYCDAGTAFIEAPTPLIDIGKSAPLGVVLFDLRPLTNRQFTKRDCFVRMNCDARKYWNANHLMATILVLRKTPGALSFVREWLAYCRDRAAITDDPNVCGRRDHGGFLQHRWDQAILSILAAKYSLETFRNPTVWGNYLKLPKYRVGGEQVPSPYGLVAGIKGYAKYPQENSPYGTLFIINRKPNLVGKKPLLAPAYSRLLAAPGKFARRVLGRVRGIA